MVFWIIGIALILIFSILGWLLSEKAMRLRTWSLPDLLAREQEYQRFDKGWYAALTREPISIPSPYGYTLAGEYWPVEESKGIMVLSHGVTVNRNASLKYAQLFQGLGFSCVAYEQCRHGESGGKYTTYGYYERYELKAVVDWVRRRFGGDTLLGVHGESMGAGILLQYAGLVEDGADFYISDCTYASIWDQLVYRMWVEYHLPAFPLMYISSLTCYLRCGFRMKETSPEKAAPHIGNPVLFFHGADDRYIPPAASQRVYDAKTTGMREIVLIEGARHATAQPTAPDQYRRSVVDFLDRAVPDWCKEENQ